MAYKKRNSKPAVTNGSYAMSDKPKEELSPDKELEKLSIAISESPAKSMAQIVAVTTDQKEILDYLQEDNLVTFRKDVEFVTYGIKDANTKTLRVLSVLTETFSTDDATYGFKIPAKFNFWWVITNFSKIIKLVTRLIEIFKSDLDNKKVTQLKYG